MMEIVFYCEDDIAMFKVFMGKAGHPSYMSEPWKDTPFTLFKVALDNPSDAFQLGVEWSLFKQKINS